MQQSTKKEDVRVLKTRMLLLNAMTALLKARNFNQVTVHDLCKEALVSRTTFYAHFLDKYDLLRSWLAAVAPVLAEGLRSAQPEPEHKRILKHLVEEADSETTELLRGFLLTQAGVIRSASQAASPPPSPEYAAYLHLCGGALLHYLTWQVRNQFPPALPLRNPSLSRFLQAMREVRDAADSHLNPK